MYEIDYQSLAKDLLNKSGTLVPWLLPGGKLQGREWVCSNLRGGEGDSLKVNLDTGLWSDFATEDKGGDLISLYAAVKGLSQRDAALELTDKKPPTLSLSERAKQKNKVNYKEKEVKKIIPIVTDSKPDFGDKFEKIHTYQTHDGKPWFYVGRKVWTDAQGKRQKLFTPFIFDGSQWIKKAPNPRPLYNLHHIKGTKQIIICEGEKAADAANKFHPLIKAVTIMGGANAIKKANLKPLAGKHILIWPDNDEAGIKFKDGLIQELNGLATEIKYLEVSDLDKKADAADINFKDSDEFIKWAKPRTIKVNHEKPNPVTYPVDKKSTIKKADPNKKDSDLEAGLVRHEPDYEKKPPPQYNELSPPPIDESYFYPTNNSAFSPAFDVDKPVENKSEPNKKTRGDIEILSKTESDHMRNVFEQMSDGVDLIPYKMETSMAIEEAGLTVSGKKPHSNVRNAVQVLNRVDGYHNKFYWDTFHQDVYTCIDYQPHEWGPVQEKTKIDIQMYLQSAYMMTSLSESHVDRALYRVAIQNEKSEPCEWVKSIEWDKKNRIDNFFMDVYDIQTQPYEYLSVVSNNFFVGMMARIFKPGSQVDTMCVFEGDQGLRKSNFLKTLVGDKYYTKISTRPEDKDSLMALKGVLICELEEMASFLKSDHKLIKGFISREVDPLRNPYARVLNKVPRQSIFVGSTNERQYLDDYTGGRRFYPIEVKKRANEDWIRENREQLFAEAYYRYQSGVKWYDNEPKDYLTTLLKNKDRSDVWNDVFLEWVETENPPIVCRRTFGEDLLDLSIRDMDSRFRNRFNEIMQRNGWLKMDKNIVRIGNKMSRTVYYDGNRFDSFDEAWKAHQEGYVQQEFIKRTEPPKGRKNHAPMSKPYTPNDSEF